MINSDFNFKRARLDTSCLLNVNCFDYFVIDVSKRNQIHCPLLTNMYHSTKTKRKYNNKLVIWTKYTWWQQKHPGIRCFIIRLNNGVVNDWKIILKGSDPFMKNFMLYHDKVVKCRNSPFYSLSDILLIGWNLSNQGNRVMEVKIRRICSYFYFIFILRLNP